MTGQEAREASIAKVPHCEAGSEGQNRLAGLVADWVREHLGVEHVLFSTRYGLARTILNDGYRNHPEPEITDEVDWEYTTAGRDGGPSESRYRAWGSVEPRHAAFRRRKAGPWVPVGEGEQGTADIRRT